MSQATRFPRWLPPLGGLLGSTTCGLVVYAFSVFIKPLMDEFHWTLSEVTTAFVIISAMTGLVTFPAGRLSDRIGARPVMFLGGLCSVFGFYMISTLTPPGEALQAFLLTNPGADAVEQATFMAAAGKKALYLFYIYYGVFCGVGGAFVYLPPIATAPKWWPDRRAMATGFTVAGLGLGSFIMGPVATKMIHHFGGTALPVFQYGSIVIAVLAVLALLCVKTPPPGYKPAGWEPPAPPVSEGKTAAFRDYTYRETRKTSQFWLLWITYCCGAFAGLMVIGLIAKHGIDALTLAFRAKEGLDAMAPIPAGIAESISTKAAYATSALAVTNALVRLSIGAILDRFGTRQIFIALVGCQVIAMLLLFPAGASGVFLAVIAAIIGWNYGALFALFPTTLMNYFGSSAQASNYGLLFTAWGIAGIFGPYTGSKLQEITGSFLAPFVLAALVLVVALLILVAIRPPEKKFAGA